MHFCNVTQLPSQFLRQLWPAPSSLLSHASSHPSPAPSLLWGFMKVFLLMFRSPILKACISCSVVDLHWFQSGSGSIMLGPCGSGSSSGHGSGLRALMTIYSWKKSFFCQQLRFFLSLGFHEGRPSYRYRWSFQTSNENIQGFIIWNFFPIFYFYR